MKQMFLFKGVTGAEEREIHVVAQMAFTNEEGTVQISKVTVENEIRYIFTKPESHRKNADLVSTYIGESVIRKNYPWALTLLPLVKLTKKQSQVMRCMMDQAFDDGNDFGDRIYVVEDFVEVASNLKDMTPKAVEGILSSLWVKGYITMATFVGPGTRYFTIDAFGLEFLSKASPLEEYDFKEDNYDEEAEEEEE